MIVVLQGRLASARLPGKGFFTFFGQTVWERMCDIATAIGDVTEVVFASGDTPMNDIIRPVVEAKGVRWFEGDEENVLHRFLGAVGGKSGDYLVRITCDNYLVQPELVEALIERTHAASADYAYIAPLSHYAGEVVRISALRENLANGASPEAMQHVTWDIRNDCRLNRVVLPDDFMGLEHAGSPSLDTLEDLRKLKLLEQNHPGLRPVRCLDALRDAHAASPTIFQETG